MTIRKQKEIEKFVKIIDREWALSIVEQDVLESVLNLFLAGENIEIKKIEHLINDEIEELLMTLDDYGIQRFCEKNFDMVAECDECIDLKDYDDDDLLDECSRRSLNWEDYERIDIVTQSNLEEMTELFLNLSPQKQSEIINNLK